VKNHLKTITALALITILVIAASMLRQYYSVAPTPIKIGVLHSLTGTMAVSEKALVDAVRLAVEEINDQGGLFGPTAGSGCGRRQVRPKGVCPGSRTINNWGQSKLKFR
jgi:hypothetical protein